jgi:hypothetical protein
MKKFALYYTLEIEARLRRSPEHTSVLPPPWTPVTGTRKAKLRATLYKIFELVHTVLPHKPTDVLIEQVATHAAEHETPASGFISPLTEPALSQEPSPRTKCLCS